ncbi:hypothetical protein O181_078683 [Austropuccinia psidii MF-1]|uniref:Uncharacterized protein n=1 Tax=Austropuccinia psidii MF-1 TaxID=1389203 RepID=A0A9Q3FF93_9BASI|nr:hypothetical protein [Austropuccinia psidii MF-1]
MNSYLQITSFLGQQKTIEPLGGWHPLSCKDKVKNITNLLKNKIILSIYQKKALEIKPDLKKEGPVVSTSHKKSLEQPKGTQKKQRGPRKNQGKGKGKANWHISYPLGYRIPKLEPSAMESVSNLSRTLM